MKRPAVMLALPFFRTHSFYTSGRSFVRQLCCLLFAAFVFGGICHAQENTGKVNATPEITAIEIKEYEAVVTVNGPISYQIHKPADPFRVVVDLQGVRLGKFNKKLPSNKPGITEITPTQIETPALVSRLDVLLQAPGSVKGEIAGDALVIRIEDSAPKPRMAAKAEEKAVSRPAPAGGTTTAGQITDISFNETEEGMEIILKGDGMVPEPAVFEVGNRLIIDIPGVAMKAGVTTALPAPVKKITHRSEDNKLKLVIDLQDRPDKEVYVVDEELVIALTYKAKPESKGAGPARKAALEERKPGEEELISLDFQDADVVAVLRLLSNVSGYNIIVHPEVKGKVTMKLMNVPWTQALDLTLKTLNLGKAVEGNIIRVAPFSSFEKESTEVAKLKESEMKAEPLDTRIFRINYADAGLVEKTVKDSKILTTRGNISFDKRTSSLVVNDVSWVFRKIETLLVDLDKPTPQVLIETRIVEIQTTSLRDLGVQWGINYKSPNTRVAIGGLAGNPQLGTGPVSGNNYVVDFPANVSPSTGSGITFGYLNPAVSLTLDVQLSAIEQANKGRIISNPRVVTTDNEKAKILQGESIPYANRTSEGTISAAFKDVAVSVEVTPHITPANSIIMNVVTAKEDLIEFVDIGQGSQAPRTTKIEGATRVLIENGETLVIGGIYRKTERLGTTGTPWLMNVPGLGWLFKRKNDQEITNEVVIFITPRIVERP